MKKSKIIKHISAVKISENKEIKELYRKFFLYMLHANIVNKEIGIIIADNDPILKNMCENSIKNSNKAIKNILDGRVKSSLSYNAIMQWIHDKYGQAFAQTLGFISGTFADEKFYESDKILFEAVNKE